MNSSSMDSEMVNNISIIMELVEKFKENYIKEKGKGDKDLIK